MRTVPSVLFVLSFVVPVGCTISAVPAQTTLYAQPAQTNVIAQPAQATVVAQPAYNGAAAVGPGCATPGVGVAVAQPAQPNYGVAVGGNWGASGGISVGVQQPNGVVVAQPNYGVAQPAQPNYGVAVAQPNYAAPAVGVGLAARPAQPVLGVSVGSNAVGFNGAPNMPIVARPAQPGSAANPAYGAPNGTMGVVIPMGGQVNANPGGTFLAPGLAPTAPRTNTVQSVSVGVAPGVAPLPPIYRRPIDPAQITAQPVPMPQ